MQDERGRFLGQACVSLQSKITLRRITRSEQPVDASFVRQRIAEAAALWESLSQNHPFVDGNKRTAIASMAAHLAMNGHWLEMEELEAYRFVMDLFTAGRFRMSELEAWLRIHAVSASFDR